MNRNKKTGIARLSILSNIFLIGIKMLAGLLTGSVSILSEAIHSAMDLITSFIAFFAVKISDTPPDKDHPYGHGKIENISGVIEALLIFVAAIWIIFEAIEKIDNPEPMGALGWAIATMFVSGLVNLIVSNKLYKTSKETDSIALEADALHLKTDVYTSFGVGVGLILIYFTGFHFLDPVIAILVATLIIREAYLLLKRAYHPLLDSSLSDQEMNKIVSILESQNFLFHNLKTRKSGSFRFAELHLELPGDTSLNKVHELCDQIEEEIMKEIPNIEVTIHAEPSRK